MTIEEIYNKLASHMWKGVMIHNEMAHLYDFLGLYGFAKCHDYHHLAEEKEYRKLTHYYLTHYFKLLQIDSIEPIVLVPNTWYKYNSMMVDNNTKKNSIKELFMKWSEWESETKKLYQEMRQQLTNIGELAAAIEIDNYICDVDKELSDLNQEIIELESVNYDLVHIIEQQSTLHNKYKKAIKKIF